MAEPLTEALKRIRFVGFDFDGVFTDNRVLVSDTGQETVICNRSDGQGLERLRKLGIDFAIFTTESNPVVLHRAKKLGVTCYNKLSDKVACLRDVLGEKGISLEQTAFVGNDINDLSCLQAVGFSAVVADAFAEVKPYARVVLQTPGGQGAVREFCDLLWSARNNLEGSQ